MDFDRIRKQKIDKTYIDEAFKEIPMYESMAVSSERESYRLAKELLTMGHANSLNNPRRTDNVSETSAPTLQSLYLSPDPGHFDDLGIQGVTGHSHKSAISRYNTRELGANDYSEYYSVEKNLLPQIMRDKPLDSPSKIRYDSSKRDGNDSMSGMGAIRAQSKVLKDDYMEDAPPSWEEINEFRAKFSEVKRNVLRTLLKDLQKKEDDYYVINSIKSERNGRIFARKVFLSFGSPEEFLDPKNALYKSSFEQIKSKLSNYYDSHIGKQEEFQDKKPRVYLYLIYSKGKIWEYLKVMIEGTRNTDSYYRYSLYNPSYSAETPTNEGLEKVIEGALKQIVGVHTQIKKVANRRQRGDKGTSDNNGCSIWESGIEVYRRLAKDYVKLSQEKISREQLYFLLVEKFYAAQLNE